MKTLLFLVLLAGVPDGSSVVKDDPFPATAPTVTAPSAVKAGKVVKLTVSPAPTNVKGLYSVTYSWSVFARELPGKNANQVDDLMVDRLDGTIAWFGADEDVAKYTYTAFATYTFVNWDAKQITTKQFSVSGDVAVTQKMPTPNPVPIPVPLPTPAVTLPAGVFQVSQLVYDTMMKVDSSKRATYAKGLAQNFRDAVKMIDSSIVMGTTVSAQQLVNAFSTANSSLIGTDLATFKPAFTQWENMLNTKKALLKTTDDWKVLLNEIALGLDAVK